MEHYMVVRFKDGVDAAELYQETASLFREAEKIEGVSRADVFISSHRLKKRYDMMIRIRMKKTALSSFEGSEVMTKWKREYGEKIENVTVFNS